MTIATDYHIHSDYSPDGHATIESICWRALALGLDTIAITDHLEWRADWYGFAQAGDYRREVAEYRRQFEPLGLSVLSGVEMGNPHEYADEANAFLAEHPMDVRIASLHWLYDENIHLTECFEGRDPQNVYADYFVELGRMVSEFEAIDVVAHFDRVLWRGALLGAPFNPLTLETLIRDTLSTIAWRGVALELNTRHLDHVPNWRPALTTMLRWFVEEGGRHVVVNSDAHRASQMGTNLDLATSVLADVGLKPSRLPLRSLA